MQANPMNREGSERSKLGWQVRDSQAGGTSLVVLYAHVLLNWRHPPPAVITASCIAMHAKQSCERRAAHGDRYAILQYVRMNVRNIFEIIELTEPICGGPRDHDAGTSKRSQHEAIRRPYRKSPWLPNALTWPQRPPYNASVASGQQPAIHRSRLRASMRSRITESHTGLRAASCAIHRHRA